ncbi:glycosyl transferase [Bacteroidia bacterium]|nr:glycosyl transferase [Bacteroidia bacterium]
MKTVGVVVAYFPDLEELSFNIASYITELDALIIWDNTPEQAPVFFQPLTEKYGEKIQVQSTGKNEGIGYALNRAAEWGINNHYDYLLTMDQDSHFVEGSLAHYLKMIQKANRSDVVMYAPMVCLISGDDPAFDGEFREQKLAITSGSIMPLSVFEKIGFFQEELFIEGVDYEMCWRAQKHDLTVLKVNHVYLNHTVGNRKEFKFLGLKLHTYNYPPVRLYYSVRNLIYLYKKYKDKAVMIDYFYNNMFKRSIAILLLETNKRQKLCAMLLGFVHGMKGKLGVYKR